MEKKDTHIKKVESVVRSITCDYCDFTQTKPDQREKQIEGWAKIEIKQTILGRDFFKTPKILYHKMDMCPDCIKARRIHETVIGRINLS